VFGQRTCNCSDLFIVSTSAVLKSLEQFFVGAVFIMRLMQSIVLINCSSGNCWA